jgi:hypothetical protein
MSLIYSPGPAAYDIGSGIGKAPAASLKGRYKATDVNGGPGPGAYRIADTLGTGLQFTMRPKTGNGEEVHTVPGPGRSSDRLSADAVTGWPRSPMDSLCGAPRGALR